ncbi:MAG TPA: hypothetical protein DDW50_21075 [Firmicutes bacterium]|nr:hypothetical protein [Bacillota bacterium]
MTTEQIAIKPEHMPEKFKEQYQDFEVCRCPEMPEKITSVFCEVKKDSIAVLMVAPELSYEEVVDKLQKHAGNDSEVTCIARGSV